MGMDDIEPEGLRGSQATHAQMRGEAPIGMWPVLGAIRPSPVISDDVRLGSSVNRRTRPGCGGNPTEPRPARPA